MIRRYVLTRNGRVQVPDEVRKCVCFILFRHNGEMKLAGTGFFVGEQTGPPVAFGTPAYGWGATVTARHVIDGINGISDDGKVYLRLNDRGREKAASSRPSGQSV